MRTSSPSLFSVSRFFCLFLAITLIALVGCRKEKSDGTEDVPAPDSPQSFVGGSITWNPTLSFLSASTFEFLDPTVLFDDEEGEDPITSTTIFSGTWDGFVRLGESEVRFNLNFEERPEDLVEVVLTNFRGIGGISTLRIRISVNGVQKVDAHGASVSGISAGTPSDNGQGGPPPSGQVSGIVTLYSLNPPNSALPSGFPSVEPGDPFTVTFSPSFDTVTFNTLVEDLPAEAADAFTDIPLTFSSGVLYSLPTRSYTVDGVQYEIDGFLWNGPVVFDFEGETVSSNGYFGFEFRRMDGTFEEPTASSLNFDADF